MLELNDRLIALKEDLIEKINADLIVPIIGDEVFFIKEGNETTPIRKYVMKEAINHLREEITDVSGLDVDELYDRNYSGMTVIARELEGDGFKKIRREVSRIYSLIDPSRIHIYEEIAEMLSICKFPLIITTSVFDLSAVMRSTCGIDYHSTEYRKEQNEKDDLYSGEGPQDQELSVHSLFHLFGRYGRSVEIPFVCTDNDLLSYLYCLNDSGSRPQRLFQYLNHRYILAMGTEIPDWTFRLLLYSCQFDKKALFRYPSDESTFIGGAVFHRQFQPELEAFLKDVSYLSVNNLLPFIKQLNSELRQSMSQGRPMVFVSYRSKDTVYMSEVIRPVFDKLKCRFEVWYSEKNIEKQPGCVKYWDEIESAVGRCDFFVPLVTPEVADTIKEYLSSEYNDDKLHKDKEPGLITEWKLALNRLQTDTSLTVLPLSFMDLQKVKDVFTTDSCIRGIPFPDCGAQSSFSVDELISRIVALSTNQL